MLFFILYFGGGKMPRVNYRSSDVDLMARMMRAEAEGEGKQGMLYVGNVIVNRVVANCLDFKDVRTIHKSFFKYKEEIILLKLFKKGTYFIKERENLKED